MTHKDNNIYTLQLCTRSSNATISSTNASVSYAVSLSTFLPLGVSKFKVQVALKSELTPLGQIPIDTGFININFANTNINNGSQQVKNIGLVYPILYGSSYSYYSSTTQDNVPFTMKYPYNTSQITIQLTTYNGSTALGNGITGGMPHYTLLLSFEPLGDE